MLTNHVWLGVLLLSQVQCFASHQLDYEDAIFVVIRGEYVIINISTNVSLREDFICLQEKRKPYSGLENGTPGHGGKQEDEQQLKLLALQKKGKSEVSRARSWEGCGLRDKGRGKP